MRMSLDPRLPILGGIDYEKSLYQRLYSLFREIASNSNEINDSLESFLTKAGNLEDLTDPEQARDNLGLGTVATRDTGTGSQNIPLNGNLGALAFLSQAGPDNLTGLKSILNWQFFEDSEAWSTSITTAYSGFVSPAMTYTPERTTGVRYLVFGRIGYFYTSNSSVYGVAALRRYDGTDYFSTGFANGVVRNSPGMFTTGAILANFGPEHLRTDGTPRLTIRMMGNVSANPGSLTAQYQSYLVVEVQE